ncbi:DUF2075 domain-containing protein [Corynebacterium aquilae]|uniref:DUF2075 domain-containing protein n=1 Tax=Corynebacterium aquilae TaxID=203263 RepID=UPI001473A41F|nr:DUF2075 domain-containing protein [Corynebacterium aquilae]
MPANIFNDWPVVYVITNDEDIYIGETIHVGTRLEQHRNTNIKLQDMEQVRVIANDAFNKSACLHLESWLIQAASGDGTRQVKNTVTAMKESSYYQRELYARGFPGVYRQLKDEGVFTKELEDVLNSEFYKFSPFKALQKDQADTVRAILTRIFAIDFATQRASNSPATTIVISGEPGTGKTIVAIYLLKALRDIAAWEDEFIHDDDPFADFYTPKNKAIASKLVSCLLMPQSALRTTLAKVFKHTPGMENIEIRSPLKVGRETDDASLIGEHNAFDGQTGKSPLKQYDILVVDEAHRLRQRSNYGSMNGEVKKVLASLGEDPETSTITELDWVQRRSSLAILLLDPQQAVRVSDLPDDVVANTIAQAKREGLFFSLAQQVRVKAVAAGPLATAHNPHQLQTQDQPGQYGASVEHLPSYSEYVRAIFSLNDDPAPTAYTNYELAIVDDLADMLSLIKDRNDTFDLARIVAGYAWPWERNKVKARKRRKKDPNYVMPDYDWKIDGIPLRWNSTIEDWMGSDNAINEVGSIHTVQGYDLNYAGVIIGPDITYDPVRETVAFGGREHFADTGATRGTKNNPATDEDIFNAVLNAYYVLATRGIRGTFFYVCDDALREHLKKFFPVLASPADNRIVESDPKQTTSSRPGNTVDFAPQSKPALFDFGVEALPAKR